jgi:hypothetical protein
VVSAEAAAQTPIARRRYDRCRNPLNDAAGNQPADRGGDRAGHRRDCKADASDSQHTRLAVVIGERATNQSQRGQCQHIAVEHPLHRRKIGAEEGAQLRERDRQRRSIDESHRGCKHTGSQYYPAPLWRDLAPKRTRAWLCGDNAAVARLDEGLRHGGSLPPS